MKVYDASGLEKVNWSLGGGMASLTLYATSNTLGTTATTLDARSITLNGSGILSLGFSNGSIVYNVPAGGGGGDGVNILAASTWTATTAGTVLFSNINGISFGLNAANGSVMTASHNAITSQSVQTQSNIAGMYDGANSISTGTVRLSNLNGVSFGINGQTLTASVAAQSNQAGTLYAVGNSFGPQSSATIDYRTFSISGVGDITVGVSGNEIRVSGAQTNQSLGIYASSQTVGQSSSSTYDARSLTIVGSGIASVGWSNSSLIVNVPSAGGGGDGVNIIAAGTRTATTNGTVLFSDSNGVSWGLNAVNGSVITASLQQNSLIFQDTNGVSWSTSSAGNTTTVSASVSHATVDVWDNAIRGAATSPIASYQFTGSHRSLFIAPLEDNRAVFGADITAGTAFLNLSLSGSTATMSQSATSKIFVGIYTSTGVSLSLLNSVSVSWGFGAANATNSDNVAGQRFLSIHSSAWSSSPNFLVGSRYYIGWFWSSSNVLNQTGGIYGFYQASTGSRAGTVGTSITASKTWHGMGQFYGIYSATTSAMPTLIQNSELNKQTASAQFMPHVILLNNTGASSF